MLSTDVPVETVGPSGFRSEETTTSLMAEIPNIPWLWGFKLGLGIDAETGDVRPRATEDFSPRPPAGLTTKATYKLIEDSASLKQLLKTYLAGSYNIDGGAKVSGSAAFLGDCSYSATSMTIAAVWEEATQGPDTPDKFSLIPAARDLLSDPPQFREDYGDYFVAGSQNGRRFVAMYSLTTSDSSNRERLSVSFAGQAPDVFTAKGSLTLQQAATEHHMNMTVTISIEGDYEGSPPPPPSTPEEVRDSLKWFLENVKPAPLRADLYHYSMVAPGYSREIAIAPEVFGAVQEIYETLRLVTARYERCPKHYKQLFKTQVEAYQRFVESHAGMLTRDQKVRSEAADEGSALLAALNAVYARHDFYLKVRGLAGTEPGQEWVRSNVSRNVWSYGAVAYLDGPFVELHVETQKADARYTTPGTYKQQLSFGPDLKKLTVGWEVVSNWTDGNNGWWKKSDARQYLLSDVVEVSVESEYDRGFSWECRRYWVDADLYQF